MRIRTILAVLALLLLAGLFTSRAPISFSQDAETRHAEAAHDRETMIDRRFDVSEGGHLIVNVGDADIEVRPGTSSDVHVQVVLEARTMDRAREYFEAQRYEVGQDDRGVYVETDPVRRTWNWRDWRDHPSIYVIITTPERFNVDLRTSDGDVRVERLDGAAHLRTSDGDIAAGTLFGGPVTLRTSDGDISLDRAEAETIEIQTSDGDVLLDEIQAGTLSARTSDGDIRALRLDGRDAVDVKTSDGDINLKVILTEVFSGRTSDGNIEVAELVAGTSTVHTSDGSIHVRRVEGALTVSGGDADVRIGLYKSAPVSIRTGDGDITIQAPSGLPADLYLHGSDVKVASSFAFSGAIEDEHAEGRINGGGPRIEARTSDGSVVFRAD